MITGATDRDIGENVRRLRTIAGLSQAALAELMSHRGFPFSQQTMLKIEKGSRPLRLVEAAELAGLLDVSTERLFQLEVSEAEHEVATADQRLAVAHRDLVQSVFAFRSALTQLRERVSHAGLTPRELDRSVKPWRRKMLDLSVPEIVEAILDEGKARERGLIPYREREAGPRG